MARLIDADALRHEFRVSGIVDYYGTPVLTMIDDAPTVDAVPVRHGRWITNDDCGELECPICGGIQIEHGMFCTWCGAKMSGGIQDDD